MGNNHAFFQILLLNSQTWKKKRHVVEERLYIKLYFREKHVRQRSYFETLKLHYYECWYNYFRQMGSSCSRSSYQCFILSPAVQYCTLKRSKGEHPFFVDFMFYLCIYVCFFYLIYFNPNNFVESGCGLEVSLFSYTPFLFLFYLLSVFFFFP